MVLLISSLHKIDDIAWFRPEGMIRMYINAFYYAAAIDEEPSWHGEFPGVVAIELREINT